MNKLKVLLLGLVLAFPMQATSESKKVLVEEELLIEFIQEFQQVVAYAMQLEEMVTLQEKEIKKLNSRSCT